MVVVVEADILISSQAEGRVEDMCLGVDAAQRACQGAAVNRGGVKRPGERLPSPVALPGVAAFQHPSLRLPLVFQARIVEHTAKTNNRSYISRIATNGSPSPGSSSSSVPRVGKVVISRATVGSLQRGEVQEAGQERGSPAWPSQHVKSPVCVSQHAWRQAWDQSNCAWLSWVW